MVLETGKSETKSVAPGKALLLSYYYGGRASVSQTNSHNFHPSGGEAITVYQVLFWDAGNGALTLLWQ